MYSTALKKQVENKTGNEPNQKTADFTEIVRKHEQETNINVTEAVLKKMQVIKYKHLQDDENDKCADMVN
jgi:hypothetical protein